MELSDARIAELIDKIDEEKRRKIIDFSNDESINYIDVNDNVGKIRKFTNNIIEARRGCGKTSLIIKALEGIDDTTITCDCQMYRKRFCEDVVLEILSEITKKTVEVMKNEVEGSRILYKKEFGGIRIICRLLKRSDYKFAKAKIRQNESLYDYARQYSAVIDKVLKMKDGETVEYLYESIIGEQVNYTEEIIRKRGKHIKDSVVYGNNMAKAQLEAEFGINVETKAKRTRGMSARYAESKKGVREISKKEEVEKLKKAFVDFVNKYKDQTGLGIMLFLDDFYQIDKEHHPFILQYFHSVSKVTKTGIFCFKVVTLPASLKMNYDNEVIFSVKDDFSKIILDYDLSDLDNIQNHLIDILLALIDVHDLAPNEIEKLFTNDDAMKYLVIATGGIPRDFMTSFADAVRISKRGNKLKIGKTQVYEVIKQLKQDKDNNIEVDSELPNEKIEMAIETINSKIVGELKTNVILYPMEKAEQHEKLLRNLINLRYIHIIKENLKPSHQKISCKAYLIDMTFYASGRMPTGFNFCEFWIKDEASRLPNLRNAPIWTFEDEEIKDILG